MKTNLIWITPNAEKLVASIARVSNPVNQDNPEFEKLLAYMIKHKHWSPFEMASACFEINTTRDIGRQILRHRSFSFQEFSQRYADVSSLPLPDLRECRLQDSNNRQNSIAVGISESMSDAWLNAQCSVWDKAQKEYAAAIRAGIAKEQARALLPEGLTPTRMYMSGTLRSWMHYCQLRCSPETQKEHRDIALSISDQLQVEVPQLWAALSFEK